MYSPTIKLFFCFQVQVYKLSELLQYYGIPSWADFSSAATPQRSKPPSGNMSAVTSSGAGGGGGFETAKLDTLQNQIMRNIRNCTAVLCCFSEQYSHSDNCYKDSDEDTFSFFFQLKKNLQVVLQKKSDQKS